MKYDFRSIEKKWQDRWDAERAFCAVDNKGRRELFRFPYGQIFCSVYSCTERVIVAVSNKCFYYIVALGRLFNSNSK